MLYILADNSGMYPSKPMQQKTAFSIRSYVPEGNRHKPRVVRVRWIPQQCPGARSIARCGIEQSFVFTVLYCEDGPSIEEEICSRLRGGGTIHNPNLTRGGVRVWKGELRFRERGIGRNRCVRIDGPGPGGIAALADCKVLTQYSIYLLRASSWKHLQ